jgi:predicted enzyme related to lactoylglutathione lyase
MRINNVTIDAADAGALARFYSGLLGREIVYDEGPWVVVGRNEPGQPNLVFQRVDDPTPGKAKVHIDIHVDDVDAVTARAVELGATRGEDVAEQGMAWRVMADPEGNPFCLAQTHASGG